MGRSLLGSCLVLFVVCSVSAYGQEGEVTTSTDIAKIRMSPLAGYIGNWKAESENKLPDGSKKKTIEMVTYEWLYEGLWIKGTSDVEMPTGRMKMTMIFGWDDASKRFRTYSFTDKGTCSESTGTWDPTAKTITWETKIELKESDLKFQFTHRTKFDSPDQFSTDITFTDHKGKETTSRSVARRVKSKEVPKKDG